MKGTRLPNAGVEPSRLQPLLLKLHQSPLTGSPSVTSSPILKPFNWLRPSDSPPVLSGKPSDQLKDSTQSTELSSSALPVPDNTLDMPIWGNLHSYIDTATKFSTLVRKGWQISSLNSIFLPLSTGLLSVFPTLKSKLYVEILAVSDMSGNSSPLQVSISTPSSLRNSPRISLSIPC